VTPQHRYVVCHGFPKLNPLPVPMSPILWKLQVYPYLCGTLATSCQHSSISGYFPTDWQLSSVPDSTWYLLSCLVKSVGYSLTHSSAVSVLNFLTMSLPSPLELVWSLMVPLAATSPEPVQSLMVPMTAKLYDCNDTPPLEPFCPQQLVNDLLFDAFNTLW
jgi:hypothetical protein